MLSVIKKIFHYFVAVFSYWFYGRPARKMIVIGVTGTKGKTTTCRLIASALSSGGDKVGMLTTAEIQIAEEVFSNDKKMTMLGRGQTQKYLKKMLNSGCRYAVVETSSQGILQYRNFGLHYDALVFTNLAPEHIEAHGGFENYKNTKAIIFRNLKKGFYKFFNKKILKIILANLDDEYAPFYLSFPADKKITFSIKNVVADVQGRLEKVDTEKTIFMVDNHEFVLPMVGDFNVYNALPAIILGREYGLSDEQIAQGFLKSHSPAGRMQMVKVGQPFNVVVDFAHETLSYEKLLIALRKITSVDGKLIAIVGSDGGGRDVSKRPKMGAIAGKLADIVFVSDVNPYNEDPMDIINQVASGVRESDKEDGRDLFLEPNRRQAISKAFALAKAGDTVAVIGKGNEKYIIRSEGYKEPWDDVSVCKEELKKLSF